MKTSPTNPSPLSMKIVDDEKKAHEKFNFTPKKKNDIAKGYDIFATGVDDYREEYIIKVQEILETMRNAEDRTLGELSEFADSISGLADGEDANWFSEVLVDFIRSYDVLCRLTLYVEDLIDCVEHNKDAWLDHFGTERGENPSQEEMFRYFVKEFVKTFSTLMLSAIAPGDADGDFYRIAEYHKKRKRW